MTISNEKQNALVQGRPLTGHVSENSGCFGIIYDPDLSQNIITSSMLWRGSIQKIHKDQLSTFGAMSTRKPKSLKIHQKFYL